LLEHVDQENQGGYQSLRQSVTMELSKDFSIVPGDLISPSAVRYSVEMT